MTYPPPPPGPGWQGRPSPPQPQQQWGPPPGQWGAPAGPPGPPPPPPKSRTGLIIGLAALVVVLAGVGVVGFITPGYFLSSDDPPAAAAGTSKAPNPPKPAPSAPKSSTPPKTGGGEAPAGAQQVITDFVAKLNAKDAAGATELVCEGFEPMTKDDITEATTGTPDLKPDKVTTTEGTSSQLGGTLNGKKVVGYVAASNISAKWCVSGLFVFAH